MSALRLLLVEDSADDAALIVREVERAWPELEWRRIETAAELEAAFADEFWDAVVADYTLPSLDALEALRRVHEYGYDGPFIVVSGTVEEEMTVAAMRAGAHDYVMKSNLRRLVPALERELVEAQVRAEARSDRRRLGEAEEIYRRLVRQLPGLVWTTDRALRVTASSGAAATPAPAVEHNAVVGLPVEELGATIGLFDAAQHRRALAGEHAVYEASWAGRDYLVHVEPFLDAHGVAEGCIGVALDLTERQDAARALRESEARFRALIENSLDVTLLLEADATVRYASPSAERVLGFPPDELVGRSAFDLVHPDDAPALAEIFRLGSGAPGATRTTTYRALHRDGTLAADGGGRPEHARRPGGARDGHHLARHHRPPLPRGAPEPVGAAGGDRPARRRDRARLQQRPARDPRLRQRPARRARRPAAGRRRGRDHEGRRPRREPHPAAARLRAAGGAPAPRWSRFPPS